MAALAEFRAQYPQYNSIDDATLADALYKKHYASRMPREEFDAKLGIKGPKVPMPGVSDEERAAMEARKPNDSGPSWGEYLTDPAAYVAYTAKQLGMDDTGANRLGRDTNALMNAVPPLAVEASPFGVMAEQINAANVAAPKVAKAITPPTVKAPVVPAEEWANRKRAAYQKVDDMGARYSQSGFDRMVDQMDTLAAAGKINPKLHPNASEMLDTLKKAKGSTPSLTELDQWRQIIRRDAQGTEAEKFFGDMMVNSLDDFIANADTKDMIAGDPKAAMEAILEARKANATFRKTEVLQDAFKEADLQAKATGSGGNIDNARRQAIKSLLKNKKKMRFFTKAEQEALKKFVEGTTPQNYARLVGKLSPEGNGLMLALQLMAGAGTGGASLPLAGVGFAAKKYAEKASQENFDDVLRLIQGAQ